MSEVSKLLCKDCKHSFLPMSEKIPSIIFFYKPNKYMYKCRLTRKDTHTEYNPVIGHETVETSYDTCSYARLKNSSCGEDGELWAPKHKKDLFLAITRGEA